MVRSLLPDLSADANTISGVNMVGVASINNNGRRFVTFLVGLCWISSLVEGFYCHSLGKPHLAGCCRRCNIEARTTRGVALFESISEVSHVPQLDEMQVCNSVDDVSTVR